MFRLFQHVSSTRPPLSPWWLDSYLTLICAWSSDQLERYKLTGTWKARCFRHQANPTMRSECEKLGTMCAARRFPDGHHTWVTAQYTGFSSLEISPTKSIKNFYSPRFAYFFLISLGPVKKRQMICKTHTHTRYEKENHNRNRPKRKTDYPGIYPRIQWA